MSPSQYNELDLESPPAELVRYRSPQVLSIVTLVLGVLCLVALIKPIYWIFPVVTLAIGGASLYSLAKHPEKIGRKAALVGLVLAIVSLTWGMSRYFSRQQWLCHQAREYADAWIELVKENRLQDAYHLHLTEERRVSPEELPGDVLSIRLSVESEYDSFFDMQPMKKLVEVAPQAEVKFERLDTFEQLPHADQLALRYRVEFQEKGKSRDLPVRLVMMRQVNRETGDYQWRVDRVDPPDKKR